MDKAQQGDSPDAVKYDSKLIFTRRSIFASGALAVLLVLAITTPHPDVAMIAACEQHSVNRDALNAAESDAERRLPLWLAYCSALAAVSAAKPQTMAGLLAKARAAKAEARNRDGTENFDLFPVQDWTWDLANDLLRLAGNGAVSSRPPVTPVSGNAIPEAG